MDYLQAAGIVIDTGAKRLHFKPAYTDQPSCHHNAFNINVKTDQDITLQPMEETKIIFNTPKNLSGKAYICSHPQLPENLNVMDGVISSNNMDKCAAIILNSSSSPILLPKATNFASVQLCSANDLKPVSFVFAVKDKQVKLTDASHLRKIDLSHVPDRYLASYKSLLTEYADVFSRHDLDVGHCKALPHQV